MEGVKFIRVRGRVVPVRADRLQTQAKVGAAAGLSSGIGARLLASGKKKSGMAFLAASFVANVGADLKSMNDSFKTARSAGLGAGVKEYAKQAFARLGGNIAGAAAAPLALKGTAKALKTAANAKRSYGFRKSTGLKDVYPTHRAAKNLLTYKGK